MRRRIRGRLLLCGLLLIATQISAGEPNRENADKPVTPDAGVALPYEQDEAAEGILRELGSLPLAVYAQSNSPFSGSPRRDGILVGGKNTPEGAYGWVKPYWVECSLKNNAKSARTYGIPKPALPPERYTQFLRDSLKRYQSHPTQLRFVVMLFTMQEMYRRKAEVTDKEILLAVYRIQFGHEVDYEHSVWNGPGALPLAILKAKGLLNGQDVIRLYSENRDRVIFEYLPAVSPQETDYLAFAEGRSKEESLGVYDRFLLLQALYRGHPDRRRELRDFIVTHIGQDKVWYHRMFMNEELISLCDDVCIKSLSDTLLNDPTTEVREQVLYGLIQKKQIRPFRDTVLRLSAGQGTAHHAETVSRPAYMDGDMEYLRQFLDLSNREQNAPAQTPQESSR